MTEKKGYVKLDSRKVSYNNIKNLVMDNYLIDRETLGQFIDGLIKKKALDVSSADELNQLREAKIRELDDRIGMAIFGSFTKAQNDEFNQLLDQDATTEKYDEFFTKHNINEEKIMTETMQKFAEEFLGGQNG